MISTLAALDRPAGHVLAIQEAVVLVADIAGRCAVGDLLRQAGAERIGAGDDDAVIDAELQKGVAAGADLGDELLMRDRDLAVLVAALLFVGNLVFDLQRAGAGLDHLLCEKIGGFGIAEAGVDIGDDRHDMGLMRIDRMDQLAFARQIPGRPRRVDLAKQRAELAGIGLAQEGVELGDQAGTLVFSCID